MNGVRLKKMNTNLGGPNQMEVLLSQSAPEEPSSASPKLTGFYNFLEEPLTPDLDLKMMGDIGPGLVGVDSLRDSSMDSFTDLSRILMGSPLPTFLGPPQDSQGNGDIPALSTLLDLDDNMKSQQYSLKRPFAQVEEEEEDCSSDLAKLSARVGVVRSRTPSLDHDYSTKRARLSPPSPVPVCVESTEEPFLVPDVSPAASPSPSACSGLSEDEKRKQRRDKNNLASKRSREIRKKKFSNMEAEADRLSKENARLEERVAELEKLAQSMKEVLVTRLKLKT